MSDLYVIAISGKLCSGKTTLADALVKAIPGSVRLGFAHTLKQDIQQLANAPITADTKDAFRALLQAYGQTMRRLYGGDYWCERWLVEAQTRNAQVVIIDDTRFPSEMEWLAQNNAAWIPVRINMDPTTQRERYEKAYGVAPTLEILHEESETALDTYLGFDVYVSATAPTSLQVAAILKFVHAYGFPGFDKAKLDPMPVRNWYDDDDDDQDDSNETNYTWEH